MAFTCEIPRCQHVKVNGVQCGSPAMRERSYCYFHYEWRQTHGAGDMEIANGAGKVSIVLPPLEDANSIQMALMEIMRLITAGQIDSKQAGLLLYALQTASANLRHISFEPNWRKVVVNPRAVASSPLEFADESGKSTEEENDLLVRRCFGPQTAEAQKPAASVESATAFVEGELHSRHYLPTSPEDWEKLKNEDFSAWLLSWGALHLPEEAFKETRENPEKFREQLGG